MNPNRFFNLGCALEAALFLAGLFFCGIFGRGILSDLHWNGRDALIGLAATLPPLVLFFGTVKSRWKPLREIREFLEEEMRPLVEGWTMGQILLVSLLAGLGEEFFFRGAIQGSLGELVGAIPALILASLVFGCFHPMTWGYLILTALIGLYLGACWMWTGNLLAPIVTHALYDVVALAWFVKGDRGKGG